MPCYNSCLYTFLPTSHFPLPPAHHCHPIGCPLFPLPPLIASHSSGVPYCPSCGTLPPPLTYLPGSTLFPLSRLLTTSLQHQVFPSLDPESLSAYNTSFFATPPFAPSRHPPLLSLWASPAIPSYGFAHFGQEASGGKLHGFPAPPIYQAIDLHGLLFACGLFPFAV